MKWNILLLFFVIKQVNAQKDSTLIKESINIHKLFVHNQQALKTKLHNALTYGHSNGWVETKKDVLQNLNSKNLLYNNIDEDSMQQNIDGKIGYVRFLGKFNVTMKGNQNTFKLKVLEVWIKTKNKWQLYARQAVKA
jgi:hypothetical protein